MVPGHTGVQSKEELRTQHPRRHDRPRRPQPHGRDASVQATAEPDARTSWSRAASTRSTAISRARAGATGCRSCRRRARASNVPALHRPRRRRVLGILLPDNRAATIWSIAVNGVMAGCRPEYMPVLVALVEAMADPQYGVEHSGNTPGGETLIILNGPIDQAARLQLHAGRDARRLPGRTPRSGASGACTCATSRASCRTRTTRRRSATRGAWSSRRTRTLAKRNRLDRCGRHGLRRRATTPSRSRASPAATSSLGVRRQPEELLPYLGDAPCGASGWEVMFTIGMATGTYRPLLVISPMIAELSQRP